MAELGEARVRLTLLDEFTKPLQTAQNALLQLGKAVAPAVIGLASIGGVIKVFKDAVHEATEAERIFTQVTAAIKSTGGAAGFTAKELAVMAKEMQTLTGINDEAVLSAEAVLLTFRSIKGDMFKGAIKAAADLSARLGTDLSSAARMVGRALENPINGLRQLKVHGLELSNSQKELIKTFIDTGQKAKAQAIIMSELTESFGGAAAAARNTFAGAMTAAKSAISDLLEVLGAKLLPLLRQAVEWVVKNADKYKGMAAAIGDFLVENVDLLITTVRILIGLQLISWIQKTSEALIKMASAALASASGMRKASVAVTEHTTALTLNQRAAMSVTKEGRAQVAAMDAAAKSTKGASAAMTGLTANLGPILTLLLLANEAVLLWSRTMQKEIDAMVQKTNKLGTAIETVRKVLANQKKGEVTYISQEESDRMLAELITKQESLQKAVDEKVEIQERLTKYAKEINKTFEELAKDDPIMLNRFNEVSAQVTQQTSMVNGLEKAWTAAVVEMKPPDRVEPEFNAIDEAIKELEKSLKKQTQSIAFYNKIVKETGGDLGEAARMTEAYNTVQATGVDMDSKRAKSLMAKVLALNAEREAMERLKAIEELRFSLAASQDKYLPIMREHAKNLFLIATGAKDAAEAEALATVENKRFADQISAMAVPMDAHIDLWKQLNIEADQLIVDMDGQIAANERYIAVIGKGTEAMRNFQIEEALLAEQLKNPQVNADEFRFQMRIQLEQGDLIRMKEEMLAINTAFTDSLMSGMQNAFKTALLDFAHGGEDAIENFGKSLLDILLNAVAEWLAAQLAAMAKVALAAAAVRVASGDSSSAYKDVAMKGASTAITGGAEAAGGWGATAKAVGGWASGTAPSGAMSMGAVAGIFAAALVAMKMFTDWSNKKKGEEYNAQAGFTTVGMQGGQAAVEHHYDDPKFEASREEGYKSKLMEILEGYMGAFDEALNGAVTSMDAFKIEVRDDEREFRVTFQNGVVEKFKTLEEAMMAALKETFKADAFEGTLDPLLEAIIENFSGGAEEMLEAVTIVQDILDEASGLSEIEKTISDMPAAVTNLNKHLLDLGVGMNEAAIVTAKWQAIQMQSIRDQITGQTQSQEEIAAQKMREAEMFNAQLALDKAKIAAEMETLRTQIEIEKAKLDVANAGASAQIEVLNATMAAYNQVLAVLDQIAPIGMDEINLPKPKGKGGKGKGKGGGPSIQDEIASTIDSLGLPLEALRDQFKQEAEAIKFLNTQLEKGKIGAERFAEVMAEFQTQSEASILGMAVGILNMMGKTEEAAKLQHELQKLEFQLKVIEFEMTIAHFQAIGAISEETAARMMAILDEAKGFEWPEFTPPAEQEMANIIDSLGLPLEALRDQFDAQKEAIRDLAQGVRDGTVSIEDFDRAMSELGDEATKSVLGMAADILEKMGKSKEAAKMRYDIEKLEWKLKLAEFELTIRHYVAIGAITRELFGEMLAILEEAQGWEFPAFEWEPPRDDRDDRDDPKDDPLLQALLDAIEDLKQMAEGYRDFLKSLERGPLSGKTMQKRFSETLTDFEETLALAQAGDIAAMHELLELGPELLNLAAEYLDPSSAAYQALLQMVTGSMDALADQMEAIVEAAPNEAVEIKLDTIIKIQQAWDKVWGGGFPGWFGIAKANTDPIVTKLDEAKNAIVGALGGIDDSLGNILLKLPAEGDWNREGDEGDDGEDNEDGDDPLLLKGPLTKTFGGGYDKTAMNAVVGGVQGINTNPANAIVLSNDLIKTELESINASLKTGFGQVVTSTDYQTETMEQLSFARPNQFETPKDGGLRTPKWRG